MGPGQLSQVMATVSKWVSLIESLQRVLTVDARDPTKHSTLKDEIEQQSMALYASARLWDDGIIKPTDTRDTLGLALALVARERGSGGPAFRGAATTWDGTGQGFGVFRM